MWLAGLMNDMCVATVRLFCFLLLSLFLHFQVYAATFVQTDWGGGASADTAISPIDQSGWDKYSEKDITAEVVNDGESLGLAVISDTISHSFTSEFFNSPAIHEYTHQSSEEFSAESVLTNTVVAQGHVVLAPSIYDVAWTETPELNGPAFDSLSGTSIALVDLDNDGDLDLLRGVVFGYVHTYQNNGTPSSPLWTYREDWSLIASQGSNATPTLADLDGDGDHDMLIGVSGAIRAYRNDGNQQFPVWNEQVEWGMSFAESYTVRAELVDIDNDKDYDLLVGYNDAIYAYDNSGGHLQPIWTAEPAWNIAVSGAGDVAVTAGDLDNDGDSDLLVWETESPLIGYENTGVLSSPWQLKPEWSAEITTGYVSYVEPALGDLDGDADFDLMIADGWGRLFAYTNTATIYNESGNLESSVIDTGVHPGYKTLTYSNELPENTAVTVEFRAGDTSTPDASWTAWLSLPNDGDISGYLSNERYFQYRLVLSTTDPSVTPKVLHVTVSTTSYPSSSNVIVADDGISLDINFNPISMGQYIASDSMLTAHASGNYVYAADDSGNSSSLHRIVDVTDPNFPVLAASTAHGGRVYDAYARGDYVYVAVADIGLGIVDVSNPTNPTVIRTVNTPGWAFSVHIDGDYAYVGDWQTGGLQIINIEDPANAYLVGQGYNTAGDAFRVFTQGEHAYLADGAQGLKIFDVSDKSLPMLIGEYPGQVDWVSVIGDYAYVLGDGFKILDISNPENIVLLKTVEEVATGTGIHVNGRYAYISDDGTLYIYDVSDVLTPVLVTSYPVASSQDVHTQGLYAYIANGAGMQVVALGDYVTTSEGVYTSSVIDVGPHTGLTTMEYSADIPVNTSLSVSIRSGPTPTPEEGEWTDWSTVLVSGDSIAAQGTNRYVQYQLTLFSSDGNESPKVSDVSIHFNRYDYSASLTSSAYNTATADNLFDYISWVETLSAGTEVRIQLRGAPDNQGVPGTWTDWLGPDGTNATYWSSDNTFSGGCIGTGEITCSGVVTSFRDAIDDQWMQYQVSLVSAGDATPTLDEITLAHTTGVTSGIDLSSSMATVYESTLDSQVIDISLAGGAPSSDVTLYFYSTNTSEGNVSPSFITFTPEDWQNKSITITPYNDSIDDNDQVFSIVTTASVSADGNYHNINPADIVVTNVDDDTSGFLITPTSGLITTESSGTAEFTVSLTSEPSADVELEFVGDGSNEATISTPSLTFTPSNWNINQTVTLTGVDDFVIDGDVAYAFITNEATSSDVNYTGLNPSDITGINNDNDVAELIVSPGEVLQTSEAGGIAPLSVMLSSQPSDKVTVTIRNLNAAEATLWASSSSVFGNTFNNAVFEFDSTNWNIPQTATLSGRNDDVIDGDIGYTLETLNLVSADAEFNNINPPDIDAINYDNDGYTITISPLGVITTTEGIDGGFDISLGTAPSAPVTIQLESSDVSEGIVASEVVFDIGETYKRVSIDAVDEDDVDGNVPYTIFTSPAISEDLGFNGIDPVDVSVINNDDVYTLTSTLHSEVARAFSNNFEYKTNFGRLVATADLNGDTYIDIIVSAPDYGSKGRVLVYYGTELGYSNTPDWYVEGENYCSIWACSSNNLGGTIAVGDVNNDTYDDLAIGVRWYDSSENNNRGQVRVYYGTPTGLSDIADWTYIGSEDNNYLGSGLAIVDVNGDGYQDLFAGAFGYDSAGQTDAGRVLGFYGTSTGLPLNADWSVEGPDDVYSTGAFGTVASAGDVNADGYIDLIVSNTSYASSSATQNQSEGKIWLYYGSASGLSTLESWSYEGNTQNMRLGSNIGSIGDVNGDGYGDFAAGGDEDVNGGINVFYGNNSVPAASIAWGHNGSSGWDYVGSTITSGDLDNDGFSDMIVGAENTSGDRRLLVFYGSTSGVSSRIGTIGDLDDSSFGSSIDASSDMNGDGLVDLVVGSIDATIIAIREGAAYIFTSNMETLPRSAIVTKPTELITHENGTSVEFTVSLSQPPSADVSMSVTSEDPGEGEVSPGVITFTADDWYVEKTVVVTGVDDAIDDGDVVYNIEFGVLSSGDSKFDGVDPDDIALTNLNDERTVTISAVDAIASEFALDEAIFNISLSEVHSLPLTVNYTVSGSALAGIDYQSLSGSVTIPSLSSDISFTLTPIDDLFVEGTEEVVVTLVSGDNYEIGALNSATALLSDDDIADVIVTPTSGLITTEAGGTDQFSVVLSSQPTDDVVIPLSSNNTSEGLPVISSLVFTSQNWAIPQSVVVTGINDGIVDADIGYSIILDAVLSSDLNYHGLNPADVSLTNLDDDEPSDSNVKLVAVDAAIAEDSGLPGVFKLVRTGSVGTELSVNFVLSGSAVESVDYVASSMGSVTFPVGESEVDIHITPTNDALLEGEESIILTLLPGNTYMLDQPYAVTMLISDDDQPSETTATFLVDQIITEGSEFTLTAVLDNESSNYPVIVPFTVSGTALNGADHNAINGEIVIDSGKEGSVAFTTTDDGPNESDETVIFTMGDPTNAAQGGRSSHTVTITEQNVAPMVNLESRQGDLTTRLVVSGDGEVILTASVIDLNPDDTHSYDWSLTNNSLVDTDLDGDPATFVFNPMGLTPGFYKAHISITDSGIIPENGAVEIILEVVDTPPLLSASDDSDGDGVSDDLESYDDSDGDGIPDYVDNDGLESHELQAYDESFGNYILRTEVGLSLRLGAVAFAAQMDGASVTIEDIANYGGGEGDAGVDPSDSVTNTGGYFDYEIWGLSQAGQSTRLVIPQFNPIPNGVVYRKYFADIGWQTFEEDDNNSIASAPGAPGVCPKPGDSAYMPGLNEGDYCIQLTIEDGGPNDTDGLKNYVITDPGTLSVMEEVPVAQIEDNVEESDQRGGGGVVYFLLVLLIFWSTAGMLRAGQVRR